MGSLLRSKRQLTNVSRGSSYECENHRHFDSVGVGAWNGGSCLCAGSEARRQARSTEAAAQPTASPTTARPATARPDSQQPAQQQQPPAAARQPTSRRSNSSTSSSITSSNQQPAQQQQRASRQHAQQQPAQQQQQPSSSSAAATAKRSGNDKTTAAQQRTEQTTWQNHRAGNWQSDHRNWQQRGGYNGYRVPDNRYNVYFGQRNVFRIYGFPSWFMVDTHDSSTTAIGLRWTRGRDTGRMTGTTPITSTSLTRDDGYYLYDGRYPGIGIAISISIDVMARSARRSCSGKAGGDSVDASRPMHSLSVGRASFTAAIPLGPNSRVVPYPPALS